MTRAELEKIKMLVEKYKYTEKEAVDIVESDKAIDKGERVYFDLDPDKEKQAKKMANVGTRKTPTIYKFDQKEKKRKENPTKSDLISFLKTALEEYANCQNLEIINKERQLAFSITDNDFELTLVQKRKKKS